ncbi:lytic transglycosylase domain-containing protein [Helicobacter saguini]|nr:lytic transglycosylase domain-containing protein [Helicobacter saguini]
MSRVKLLLLCFVAFMGAKSIDSHILKDSKLIKDSSYLDSINHIESKTPQNSVFDEPATPKNTIDNTIESADDFSIDFNEYSMLTPINTQVINRFNEETISAFSIPTEYIATLEKEERLIAFDTRKWQYLSRKFDNGYEFIPILRKMLFDADIPQEFLFLAMAESEFDARALSVKKAAGIWQFMPATARELGLKINDYIDERADPIKSTAAAIRYLQYLYNATGKWYLAAMAYNCGLGRLNRAIKEAGSDNVEVLLDEEAQYLPLETRDYLRKIISMSLAFSNAHELKQMDKEYMLNRGAADSIVVVSVKSGNSLKNIAKGANMSVDSLKNYNRHFKYDFVPLGSGDYQVYLPYEKLSYFKQHFKDVVEVTSLQATYIVKKGDTLSSIARKNNTSVDKLKSLNKLKSNNLSINQKLLIPLKPINIITKNKYAKSKTATKKK